MKLLLDTHAFLWFITDAPSLSSKARELIEDSDNDITLSVASLWEMAIKVSLGKLTISQPLNMFMAQQLHLNAINLLNISVDHAAMVATLPFHHRDPFDRLLVAQAIVERLSFLSVDTVFDAYGVDRKW
jgi:PIN domain nuclease of toxin-antitoxin system